MAQFKIFILLVICIFLFVSCSSVREIPKEDISRFSSLKSLYEAKYKGVWPNKWYVFDEPSREIEFLIATNWTHRESCVKELLEITETYCSSKGGILTIKATPPSRSISTASQLEFEAQMKRQFNGAKSSPFIICATKQNMLFEGIYSTYSYTAGGLPGTDIRVWMREL